jgi:hypothetical protein
MIIAMTTLPDPASIDWAQIAAWCAGIGTVLGSIGGAVWLGVSRATKVAEGLPQPAATIHKTDVYTTDSPALQELARSLEAGNVLMTEGNALRREATDERRSLKGALDENTEMTEKSINAITELRTDIRRLTDEFIRSGRR